MLLETPDVDMTQPLVPREDRRQPKLRYTLVGLLKSKLFWFNIFTAFAAVMDVSLDSVKLVLGDKVTAILVICASVVNVYLRTTAIAPVAANTEAGRADLEAAKRGQ